MSEQQRGKMSPRIHPVLKNAAEDLADENREAGQGPQTMKGVIEAAVAFLARAKKWEVEHWVLEHRKAETATVTIHLDKRLIKELEDLAKEQRRTRNSSAHRTNGGWVEEAIVQYVNHVRSGRGKNQAPLTHPERPGRGATEQASE